MSDQPKPTGEWTVGSVVIGGSRVLAIIKNWDGKIRALVNYPEDEIIYDGCGPKPDRKTLKKIAEAHNAALASERENVVLATQMVHVESKRANTAERTLESAYENHHAYSERLEADYQRDLDKKLAQINAQANTIRRLTRALGEMLQLSDHPSDDNTESTIQWCKSVLEECGTYPLPDGRTS